MLCDVVSSCCLFAGSPLQPGFGTCLWQLIVTLHSLIDTDGRSKLCLCAASMMCNDVRCGVVVSDYCSSGDRVQEERQRRAGISVLCVTGPVQLWGLGSGGTLELRPIVSFSLLGIGFRRNAREVLCGVRGL